MAGTAITKSAPGFVTEYWAGNVRGVELFAIETEGEETCTESDAEIEKPYYVDVRINDKQLKMEEDTGAAVSVMAERLYKRKFKKVKLMPTNCVLRTYSKQ